MDECKPLNGGGGLMRMMSAPAAPTPTPQPPAPESGEVTEVSPVVPAPATAQKRKLGRAVQVDSIETRVESVPGFSA